MKAVILATMMILGVSAAADTVKTVKVCGYGRHSSSADDCKWMTYTYFTPRMEQYCMQEGNGQRMNCFNRLVTGNYQASTESWAQRRLDEKGGKNNGAGGRRGCRGPK